VSVSDEVPWRSLDFNFDISIFYSSANSVFDDADLSISRHRAAAVNCGWQMAKRKTAPSGQLEII